MIKKKRKISMPGREGESKRDKEAERDKAGGELS